MAGLSYDTISEWHHKTATNDRQQQSQQQRNVSAAGDSNTVSAGDAMTSKASVVPATVSVVAQSALVTTGANMMTSLTIWTQQCDLLSCRLVMGVRPMLT